MKKDLATLQKELKIITYHMNMSGLNSSKAQSNFEYIEKKFEADFSKIWSTLIQDENTIDWIDWEQFSVTLGDKRVFFSYNFGYGELTIFQANINEMPINIHNKIDIGGSSLLKYTDVIKRLELIQAFLKVAYLHPDVWDEMRECILNYNVEKKAYENHSREVADFKGQIRKLEDLIQAQSVERTFTFTPYSYLNKAQQELHDESVEKFKNALIELFPSLKDSFQTKMVIVTSTTNAITLTTNAITLKQWLSGGGRRNRGKYIPLLYIPTNKPFVLSDKIYLRLKEAIY